MPKIQNQIRSLLRATAAGVFAVGALAAGGAAALAFSSPVTAPTDAGFTSGSALLATMSGSVANMMGAGFDTATDSLAAISAKLNLKLGL